MVGHTGVFEAAVKAVETVDSCLGRIVSAVLKAGGKAMVIADHGNAEQMIDYQTGAPHTAHTTYPVPCILIGADSSSTLRKDGALCDVAPTMLKLMGLEVPAEMSGESL
jgi:2,3-bisphosphoglycerate-independent phosphoglycerate mutase